MARKDPKYVKLANRLVRSSFVDLGSGWSIAGLDVREFPGDNYPTAQAAVRARLRSGVLEEASDADFEAVQFDKDFLSNAGVTVKQPEVDGYFQESHVVGAAEEQRLKIEESRGFGGGTHYSDDKARRESLLKQQREEDSGATPGDTSQDASSGDDAGDPVTADAGTEKGHTGSRRGR